MKSILTNAAEIGYPRSLFVRRTVDARANRPMKDMIHWILYEELRFVMAGEQMESELQHQLNAFLGKFRKLGRELVEVNRSTVIKI